MLKNVACLTLAASSVVACGGHIADVSDDGGVDGAQPISDDSGPPPPGFDGGQLDASPLPPPPQVDHRGYVVLEATLDSHTYAGASFFDQAAPECAFMAPTSGCAIQTCPANGAQQSAGIITIRGGTQDVTLTPTPNGATGVQYKAFDASGILFQDGSTLTITGQGDVVPAFQGRVVFPSAISVTAPTISTTQPTLIDTSADLAIGWSGATTGQTLFYLQSDAGNGSFVSLGCFFDASAEKAIVPSALLRSFKALVTNPQNTYVLVFPSARATVVTGRWGVELFAVGQGPLGQASLR